MILQNAVWAIALTGMGVVALAFLYIVSQASRPADDAATRKSAHTSHVMRRWLFVGFVITFVVGTYATLRHFPIPAQQAPVDDHQVIDVVGRQWSWELKPDTVQAGSPVVFEVTSSDVNHGFAIYDPDGRIVTQTQAMPGYTNRIVHTFVQPGSYRVRCLEYCGLGHAPMTATITVLPATGS